MKKLVSIAILATTFVGVSTVGAESLEEKKYWKGQMDYMNEALESASKVCDVKFTFDWVEKGKLREAAEKNQNSPNGICDNVVNEVASLCRNDKDSKDAVKAKIKGFTCGYKAERSLDMKGGIVTYLGNNQQANFSDWAKPWLEKHL